jgi:hypothetical protein
VHDCIFAHPRVIGALVNDVEGDRWSVGHEAADSIRRHRQFAGSDLTAALLVMAGGTRMKIPEERPGLLPKCDDTDARPKPRRHQRKFLLMSSSNQVQDPWC